MPNSCYFTIKMLGGKASVEEMSKQLSWDGEYALGGLGKVYSFEHEAAQPTVAKNIYTIQGQGDCAHSLFSSLQAVGMTERQNEDGSRSVPFLTLEGQTEQMHMAIEAYSSETDIGFQEHLLIVDGKVLIQECKDYFEQFIETQEDINAFNEEHGTSFSMNDTNINGELTLGGYGEQFGDFSILDNMTSDFAKKHGHWHEPSLADTIKQAKESAAKKNVMRPAAHEKKPAIDR